MKLIAAVIVIATALSAITLFGAQRKEPPPPQRPHLPRGILVSNPDIAKDGHAHLSIVAYAE